jgi:cell division protease FtsH
MRSAADHYCGGIAGATMEDTKNKKLVTYHEVGHAIIGSVLENHDEVEKITLIRVNKGPPWTLPLKKIKCYSRSALLAQLLQLAGRVTGASCFSNQVTTWCK